MSDLPADCVALILRHYSLLERLNAGRVSKSWLLGSRSRMANEKLFPGDLTGKSLPLARKYAYEYAKTVIFRKNTDILGCGLPSVEHIEIPPLTYTGSFFIELITKVLDASKIVSFIGMNVDEDVDSAISRLALLTNIQRLDISQADPRFIIEALKQLKTLTNVAVTDSIEVAPLVDILTSQEPPVLWKDAKISLRNTGHELLPLLASRMPHLYRLFLWCPSVNIHAENLRISHPTLVSFTFIFFHMRQKIEIHLPKATYCFLSAMVERPVELKFESGHTLQRLDLKIGLLKSILFSTDSPPVHLRHVSLQNFGYQAAESTIDVILSCCTALETLHIQDGKLFEHFQLQNVSSTALREISIFKCRKLSSISVANNRSLQNLKTLNISFDTKLASISLDSTTSPLPSLETIDISHCVALNLDSLASFCNQVTSLRKLVSTGLQGNALRATLANHPAVESLQIEVNP